MIIPTLNTEGKALAIIPARGGSKRIPRKNIKNFLGKPIIAYSIEAAIQSGLFSEVMVSTDDTEIAAIALQYGAKVPFMRSTENANDFATTVDVLTEVLEKYQQLNKSFQYACCIYPTAPFVSGESLQKAFQILSDKGLDAVFPIQRFSFPPQRGVVMEQEKIRWKNPENAQVRSQDLEPMYHDAGQFYFFRTNAFLTTKQILGDNTGGMIISEMDAHDIDNEEDWKIAEFKFSLHSKS